MKGAKPTDPREGGVGGGGTVGTGAVATCFSGDATCGKLKIFSLRSLAYQLWLSCLAGRLAGWGNKGS